MAIYQIEEMPPKPFLMQVLNHCSKAALLYIHLWEKRDKDNRVIMTKEDVSHIMHHSAFRDNLRKLNCEGLIDYSESLGGIWVEMVDWQDVE